MTISTHNLDNIDPNSDQDIIDATAEIIKKEEKFVGYIYDDGNGVPTIGYGIALLIRDASQPAGKQWSIRPQNQLDDIFDGTGQTLSVTDPLLIQAMNYLNGIKGVKNPFYKSKNATGWSIAPTDGERMIKNILSSDPSIPVTQAIDMINGPNGLRNQLGQVLTPTGPVYLWDTLKDSREGAALLSLWYNGESAVIPKVKTVNGNVTGGFLLAALQGGDRLAAWFEIRYNSNGNKSNGIAKRRFWESAIFGLYDGDPANVSDAQAQEIIDFLLGAPDHPEGIAGVRQGEPTRLAQMIAYEQKYNRSNLIADDAVNTYSPTNNTGKGQVRIWDLFKPIAAQIAKHEMGAASFNAITFAAPTGANSIVVWGMDLNPRPTDVINTGDEIFNGSDDSDLLIGVEDNDYLSHDEQTFTFNGKGGDDTVIGADRQDEINGGAGNDVLYGGKGDDIITGGADDDTLIGGDVVTNDNARDQLDGGAGNDTYYVHLNDVITDSDGTGRIFINNQEQFNSTSPVSNITLVAGTSNIYTNNDPANPLFFRLLSDNTLQIIGGDYIELKEFASGKFGITLDPSAVTPGVTPINGTTGDDLQSAVNAVTGSTANEELHGLGGNDDVLGNGGNDALFGEAGDDFIVAAEGNDVLDGGANRDTLISKEGTDILLGGAGVDLLLAGDGNDFLDGGNTDESDYLAGGAGSDILFGGGGNDVLWGDGSFSVPDPNWSVAVTYPTPNFVKVQLSGIFEDSGISGDVTSDDDQSDVLYGGAGNDVLYGGGGNDQLYGEDENDFLIGGGGDDRLEGGAGVDNLFGDDPSNQSITGNDVLIGGDGNDHLEGGLGDDEIYGGIGDDTINGDYLSNPDVGGNDLIYGGQGVDIILAGAGDDIVYGGSEGDGIDGGKGNDTIFGGSGADGLHGGDDNDLLMGETGSDDLFGGKGDDILDGGIVEKGETRDVLEGEEDNDTYQFGFKYGKDIASDIAGAADKIKLLPGITKDNVKLTENGGDLVLTLLDGNKNPTGDLLIVNQWFRGNNIVETIEFANGVIWDKAEIEKQTGVKHNPASTPTPVTSFFVGTPGVDIGLIPGDTNDVFYALEGNDLIAGGGGQDRLFGGKGDDELQGNNDNDELYGEEGNDRLFGQAGDDQLFGGEGNDNLYGNEGDDTLGGGAGADNLAGGTGNDTYLFNRGDGDDFILDDGGVDTLILGEGISPNDVSVTQGSLILTVLDHGVPTADKVTIVDWQNPDNQIESIQFNDGTVWDVPAIQSRLPDAITLVDGLNAQGSSNVTTYTFTPSAANPDGFSITLSDGGGLDQLVFQSETLVLPDLTTFHATPSLQDASRDGNDLVLTVAVDSQIGTIPSGSGQVRIVDYYTAGGFIENIAFPTETLNDPNLAPAATNAVPDQIIALDTPYTYQLATDTFTDGPFDLLTYTVTLADGSDLPAWLSFDPDTQTFSGTPTAGDSAFLDISITARDTGGLTAATGFSLNVGNINLAPELAAPVADQTARAQEAFAFTLPAGTFTDKNPGDSLTFSALLDDGSALPAWLNFDAATRTFSGTPADLDVGTLSINVTAVDAGGLTALDTFALKVNEFNAAPVAQPDQATVEVNSSPANTSEFLVNTNIGGDQTQAALAALADGSFMVVWNTLGWTLAGQRIDSAGNKVGPEIPLTSYLGTSHHVDNPAITALSSGGYVVTWRASDPGVTPDGVALLGQVFDGNDQEVGSQFTVGSGHDGEHPPAIAALPDGGFVVVWGDTSNNNLYGQRYDATGGAAGAEFLVKTFSDIDPDIAVLNNGNFVVVWNSAGQLFDVNGDPVGAEFAVGRASIDRAYNPRVAVLRDGSFVVAGVDSDFTGLTVDKFDSGGQYLESFYITDPNGFFYVKDQEITALSDGSFVVTWTDNDAHEILGAKVDTAGQMTTFTVSQHQSLNQLRSDVVELADGTLAVVWDSSESGLLGDGSGTGVLARVFPPAGGATYLLDVLANDTDADAGDDPATFTLLDAVVQQGGGLVSIENNKIKFDPGSDFSGLTAGQTQQVVIDYTMTDDGGATSSSTLTLTVRGGMTSSLDLSGTTVLTNGGRFVDGAGDINGDGFADFIIGPVQRDTGYPGDYFYSNGAVVFGSAAGPANPQDLASLDGVNGFNLYAQEQIGDIHGAGDVNGDGFDDLIIGAKYSSLDGGIVTHRDRAYVVFGGNPAFGSQFDFSSVDGSDGFRLLGPDTGNDFSVPLVDGAGDINGDGLADLIISASYVGDSGTAEAYVVFGSTTGFGADVDVAALDGSNGFHITGFQDSDNLFTVSSAGDVNGDGFGDLIVGQSNAGNYGEGEAYVVFGQAGGFAPTFDINDLDGSNGFRLVGFDAYSYSQLTVASAGDINGDGFDDLIIGKYRGNDYAGAGYVVFGTDSGFGPAVDVSTLDGSNGFKLLGSNVYDYAGASVSGAGDVNGDGFDDLLISAPYTYVSGRGYYTGTSYLVFGQASGFAPAFNLDSVDGSNGLRLDGRSEYSYSGYSVSGVGDVNGDGFADMLIADRVNYDYAGGISYLVYGRDFRNQAGSLGTGGDDIVQVVENDQRVFTLGGDDIISVGDVVNAYIDTGAGDDVITLNGGNNIFLSTGTGNNTVNIGGSSFLGTTHVTVQESRGGHTSTSVTTVVDQRYIMVMPGLNGGNSDMVIDVNTGQTISASSVKIHPGSLVVDINDGQVELHFEDIDLNHLIDGPTPFSTLTINNSLTFTYQSLLDLGFDIDGTAGDDTLAGTEVTDRLRGLDGNDSLAGLAGDDNLDGGGGNDVLDGGTGNDTLIGGSGDDTLAGGAGDDTYLFHPGDGSDVLTDSGGIDQVVFGAGISASNLLVEQTGNDLVISLLNNGQPTTDSITITDWYLDPARPIEHFVFTEDNLTLLSGAEMEALIGGAGNQPPVVDAGIADQATDEDAPFSFTVPAAAFSDPDAGDTLVFGASLVDSSPLPSWLLFNSETSTFTGTPTNDDVGALAIQVTATDTAGEVVSDSFTLTINNVNDAPVVANAIPDQATDEDATFSFTVPADTFADDDSIHGDTLSYGASLADDSVLPAWLSFDQLTQTFSGTPANEDVGNLDLKVTATDGSGAAADDVFRVVINNTNDPVFVDAGIADQTTDEDAPFSFTIPANAFGDVDVGDTISYSVAADGGGPLPAWLVFDQLTQTFSGTPDNNDVGITDIRVTASDAAGTTADDVFRVTVNNVNDAPVLVTPIADQATVKDQPFSFVVPAGTFLDPDVGDTLTYSASLDDGSLLPAWLSFDAGTQTFSGTPTAADAGIQGILVTATDSAGVSAIDTFTLTISNTDGTSGDDILIGTPGIDNIAGLLGNDFINGLAGDDHLEGDGGNDTLFGDAGNDNMYGGANNDYLDGGDGNDYMEGDGGDDTLYGGAGMDTMIGGANSDFLDGGDGDDHMEGNGGDDTLIGGNGNDFMDGGANIDYLDGGAGNDILNGGGGNDTLIGGDGDDVMDGGANADYLDGGAGNDILTGSGGNDQLYGRDGNDQLFGGADADYLDGGAGDDVLDGAGGNDIFFGGDGNDILNGGANADVMDGGAGNDILIGLGGLDTLLGGAGDDQLTGSADADILDGGTGNDIMAGSGGNDTYQFNLGYGLDTIVESSGADTVNLSNAAHDQLWFWQDGNDLRVGILNTTDWLTIQDWYLDNGHKVETFKTTDDSFTLLNSQIDQLVQAMAVFDVQAAGNLYVPQQDIDNVQSVIAAAWSPT